MWLGLGLWVRVSLRRLICGMRLDESYHERAGAQGVGAGEGLRLGLWVRISFEPRVCY